MVVVAHVTPDRSKRGQRNLWVGAGPRTTPITQRQIRRRSEHIKETSQQKRHVPLSHTHKLTTTNDKKFPEDREGTPMTSSLRMDTKSGRMSDDCPWFTLVAGEYHTTNSCTSDGYQESRSKESREKVRKKEKIKQGVKPFGRPTL